MINAIGMAVILAGSLVSFVPISAQETVLEKDDLGSFLSGSDDPLQVEADEMRYDASDGHAEAIGNAIARQDDKKITADHLVLNFDQKGHNTDLTQDLTAGQTMKSLIATGHVHMTSDQNAISAQKAVYDVGRSLLTLEGDAIEIQSPKGSLNAHQSVVYDRNANIITASGDVELVQTSHSLKAPQLKGVFKRASNKTADTIGGLNLSQAEAWGGVTMMSPEYVSRADTVFYESEDGLVRMEGNVQISDGKNIFTGPCGEYNSIKKTAQLTPCKKGTRGRVKALLYPKSKES